MPRANLKDKKIAIIGHITEIYGPVQALINYLVRNVDNLFSILHPFYYSSISSSEYRAFEKGECKRFLLKRNMKFSELLSYFQHFALTLYYILRSRERFDIYIGIDNLNAFTGILLRRLGIVGRVIYYVIDYTPKRFRNPIKNHIYHFLDRFCVKHSDYIWNISERIRKIRREQGISEEKNLVVPVGVELEKIKYVPEQQIRRDVLVFVSHLQKSKGVQLVIEAMEDIIREVPGVKLEIIGTGPYEKELVEMVNAKSLNKYIQFLGSMDHDKLLEHLPHCGIALASYVEDPDSITYYADPTKPKEYLACGLPTIITRLPWIALDIEEKPMGIAIDYDKRELKDAIIKLLRNDKFYNKCRMNALKFTSNLQWSTIFDNAFMKMSRGENVTLEY